jgi:tetratricopeptide (TPR) repeat protein
LALSAFYTLEVNVTTISLHDYLSEINQLLEDSRVGEAAAHCRYILHQFPRHVDTYRALAQALLEQGQYADAVDLFHRVLSTEPSDFVSHLGLAIIYEEQQALAQSIWHMERAYEMKPYDPVVQSKLKELYGLNQTPVPRRLSLTQGALARVYLKGELYQQAAIELRQVMRQDSDRIDLEVLLAETLWRDGRRVEAAEVCHAVLERLPNCLQANAILAEIWLQTGRTTEAEEHLELLQELTQLDVAHCDVETVIGRAFTANGSQFLPEQVEIAYLEDIYESASGMGESSGITGDSAFTPSESIEGDGTFSWLQDDVFGEPDAPTDDTAQVEPAEEGPSTESLWLVDDDDEIQEEPIEAGPLPDWLVDSERLGETAKSADDVGVIAADEPVVESGEASEALSDGDDAGAAPDWLVDASDSELEPIQADPSTVESVWFTASEAGLPPEDTATADEDADWLSMLDELDDGSSEPMDLSELDMEDLAEIGEEAGPDWLLVDDQDADEAETSDEDDADAELLPPVASSETSEAAQVKEEIPEWLSSGSFTEEIMAESQERTEDLSSPAIPTPSDLDDQEDLPDWLSSEALKTEVQSEEGEKSPARQEEASEADEEIPTWLSEPDSEDGLTEEVAVGSEIPSDSAFEEEELPDWLRSESFDTKDGVEVVEQTVESIGLSTQLLSEGEADIPEWLQEEGDAPTEPDEREQPEVISEVPSLGVTEDEGLPSWLQEGQFDTQTGIEIVEQAVESLGLSSQILAEGEADIPDWMLEEDAGTTAETDVTEPPAETSELPATIDSEEGDLPSWLQEGEFDTQAGIAVVEQAVESLGLSTEILSQGDADMPDWLQEEDTGAAADADEKDQPDQIPEEPPAIDSEAEDLPSWLDEGRFDTQFGIKIVDEAVESLGLSTEILKQGEGDDSEPLQEKEAAAAETEVTEQLEEIPEVPSSGVSEDEDLPSWLDDGRFDTRFGIELVEEAVESLGLSTEMLSQDDADLPDWLDHGDESADADESQVEDEAEDMGEPVLEMPLQEDLPEWMDVDAFHGQDELETVEGESEQDEADQEDVPLEASEGLFESAVPPTDGWDLLSQEEDVGVDILDGMDVEEPIAAPDDSQALPAFDELTESSEELVDLASELDRLAHVGDEEADAIDAFADLDWLVDEPDEEEQEPAVSAVEEPEEEPVEELDDRIEWLEELEADQDFSVEETLSYADIPDEVASPDAEEAEPDVEPSEMAAEVPEPEAITEPEPDLSPPDVVEAEILASADPEEAIQWLRPTWASERRYFRNLSLMMGLPPWRLLARKVLT